jgi:polyisoprenyl-phosphate glycosyltransferase
VKNIKFIWRKKKREGESFFKLLTAAVFYRILRKTTSIDIPVDTGDFRLMDRKVVEELTRMRGKNRFVRGMISWVGFKQEKIEYTREKRSAGKTKFSYKKMAKFAIDAILSFSQAPLKFSSAFGFFCSLISFSFIIYGFLTKYLSPETTVHGWTSIFVVSLFLGGLQLLSIGILGEYLGRISEEIKGRPLYIVEEAINFGLEQATDPVLKVYSDQLSREVSQRDNLAIEHH